MVISFYHRFPVMPKERKGGKHCQYDEKKMQDALEAVKWGQSLKGAAKMYGVPRMTLSDKV